MGRKKNKKEVQSDKDKIENQIQDDLEISPEVVATIAGVAISEVIGTNRITGFFDNITDAFKTRNKEGKGIKVDIKENKCKIDANIIVDFGTRIPEVAFEIQTRVKKSVEAMTGLEVREVNVHVQGINMDVEKTKDEVKDDVIIENNPKEDVEWKNLINLYYGYFH